MNCTICQTENRDNRRFCKECGASLDLICTICLGSNEYGSRYCGSCGTRLPEEAVRGAAASKVTVDDIEHPEDIAAKARLRGNRAVLTVMGSFLAEWEGESGGASRVRSTFPVGDDDKTIWTLFRACQARLNTGEVELRFRNDSEPRHETVKVGEIHYIILTTGLIEQFDEFQVRFVLGHEFGHIMCEHVPFLNMQAWLQGKDEADVSQKDEALEALLSWCKAASLTADRAGFLCSGGVVKAREVILACGGEDGDHRPDNPALLHRLAELEHFMENCLGGRLRQRYHPYFNIDIEQLVESRNIGLDAAGHLVVRTRNNLLLRFDQQGNVLFGILPGPYPDRSRAAGPGPKDDPRSKVPDDLVRAVMADRGTHSAKQAKLSPVEEGVETAPAGAESDREALESEPEDRPEEITAGAEGPGDKPDQEISDEPAGDRQAEDEPEDGRLDAGVAGPDRDAVGAFEPDSASLEAGVAEPMEEDGAAGLPDSEAGPIATGVSEPDMIDRESADTWEQVVESLDSGVAEPLVDDRSVDEDFEAESVSLEAGVSEPELPVRKETENEPLVIEGPSPETHDVPPAIAGVDFYYAVVDMGNHRIQFFSKDGMYLRGFGKSGTLPGQFNSPKKACLLDGKLYISDFVNCRVQWFDLDGTALGSFGAPGSEAGELSFPTGLARVDDGRIIVLDAWNGRVQKFESRGQYVSKFGGPGSAPGSMSTPGDLCAIPGGGLWVADTGNNRLQFFDELGAVVRTFGEFGSAPGCFDAPTGIVCDDQGKLYVADSGNARVQVLDQEGTSVFSFGDLGETPGKMDTPSGLALNPDGHIVVADTWNNRVQVFEPTGVLVMAFGKQGTMPGELEYPNDVLIIPVDSLSGVEE